MLRIISHSKFTYALLAWKSIYTKVSSSSVFQLYTVQLPKVQLVPSPSSYLLTQMYLGRNTFNITLVLPRYRRQQKLILENTLKILVKSLENTLLKQNMRHRLTKWTNVESNWSITYKHKNHIGLKTVAECGLPLEQKQAGSSFLGVTIPQHRRMINDYPVPTYFTNIRRDRTTTVTEASLTVLNCHTSHTCVHPISQPSPAPSLPCPQPRPS